LPEGKLRIPATVVIGEDTQVAAAQRSRLEPDELWVLDGARLFADAARSVELHAFAGDITVRGAVDAVASDDIVLRTRAGQLAVQGRLVATAGDRLSVVSDRGPIAFHGSGQQTLAGSRVMLRAPGADGWIDLAGVDVRGQAVALDARANVSVQRTKGVRIAGGSVVTTNPTRTGRSGSAGDVTVVAAGDVVVADGAVIDSGRNVRIQTQRAGDRVCLSGGATLIAADGRGTIDLRGARGGVVDDGSTRFVGRVLGTIQPGECFGPAPD
jgi:hypothetical protein